MGELGWRKVLGSGSGVSRLLMASQNPQNRSTSLQVFTQTESMKEAGGSR
jgi:hypothetical protein